MQKKILLAIASLIAVCFTLHARARRTGADSSCAHHCNVRAETEKFSWIGTNHGLCYVRKKDGQTFHMNTRNSPLPSDTITALAVRRNGEVFIGTTRGLLRYDNYAFLRIDVDNSALLCNRITSLACTTSNDVYAGTQSGGITVFSGSRSATFNTRNAPFTTNHVAAIAARSPDSLIVTLGDSMQLIAANKKFWLLRRAND